MATAEPNASLHPRQFRLRTAILSVTFASVIVLVAHQIQAQLEHYVPWTTVPATVTTVVLLLFLLRQLTLNQRTSSLPFIGWLGTVFGGAIVCVLFAGSLLFNDFHDHRSAIGWFGHVLYLVTCPISAFNGFLIAAFFSPPGIVATCLIPKSLRYRSPYLPGLVCGIMTGIAPFIVFIWTFPSAAIPAYGMLAACVTASCAAFATRVSMIDRLRHPDWRTLLPSQVTVPPESSWSSCE